MDAAIESMVRGKLGFQRCVLLRHIGVRAQVIAKIEKSEAVDALDEVLAEADAAMVARQVGLTNPEETEARRVLTGVLAQVHGLLCVRAAYFDRRRVR